MSKSENTNKENAIYTANLISRAYENYANQDYKSAKSNFLKALEYNKIDSKSISKIYNTLGVIEFFESSEQSINDFSPENDNLMVGYFTKAAEINFEACQPWINIGSILGQYGSKYAHIRDMYFQKAIDTNNCPDELNQKLIEVVNGGVDTISSYVYE